MSTPIRVTLKDIAAKAELSVAAVSLALRDKPSIPRETIARVKKLAEDMGYIPDPALSALAARRKQNGCYRSVVAMLSDWDTRDGWLKSDGAQEIFEGAKQRAKELGYELRHVWAREDNMSDARLSDVLKARGIRGIVLATCQSHLSRPLKLDWDAFSIVSVENPTIYPSVPNITQDQYAATSHCWQRLLELGYKRVGLVVPQNKSDRWGNRWEAAHALHQARHEQPQNYVPTLHVTGRDPKGMIRSWLRRYRPDAVISRIPCFRNAAEEADFQIPQDLGFVSLNLKDDMEPFASGIIQHREEMGIASINTLNSLLQTYERGLHRIAQCTQIIGSWHEGNTLVPASELSPQLPVSSENNGVVLPQLLRA